MRPQERRHRTELIIPGADRDLTLLLICSGHRGMPDLLEGGRALAPGAALLSP
jgi:hypothetical protein